jgi:hypothetical protein
VMFASVQMLVTEPFLNADLQLGRASDGKQSSSSACASGKRCWSWPDDHLRLKHTIALIRQAEVARAKRQTVDAAAWR